MARRSARLAALEAANTTATTTAKAAPAAQSAQKKRKAANGSHDTADVTPTKPERPHKAQRRKVREGTEELEDAVDTKDVKGVAHNDDDKTDTEDAPDGAEASEIPEISDFAELEVGSSLRANLTLANQDDETVDFSEIVKKTPIVVVFAYPKASTPGCTRQVCGFRDNYAKFTANKNVKIYGLSADSPAAQKKFQTKQKAQYELLSDPKHELLGPLGGTKTPGKVPKGVIRSHWIFKDGKLAVKEVKIGPEASFTKALEVVEGWN